MSTQHRIPISTSPNAIRLALVLILLTLAPALASARSLHLTPGDSIVVTLPSPFPVHSTVEMWVRPSSPAQSAFPLFVGYPDVLRGYGFIVHDGYRNAPGSSASISVGYAITSVTGNSARLASGRWTHVAIVRDDSVWYLYRNGMIVGRGMQPYDKAIDRMHIGCGFDGDVDEIRIWSRARSHDEVRASHATVVASNAPGLVAAFSMEQSSGNVLRNDAATGARCDGVMYESSSAFGFIDDSPALSVGPAPGVEFAEIAEYMQFFAREPDDSASVELRGRVLDETCDSIAFDMLRNDTLIASSDAAITLNDGGAAFEHIARIRAECALYTVAVRVRSKGAWRPLFESADLVAGDVYMIAGQSNSHPADTASTWTSPYVRSFGVQTNHSNYDPYDCADVFWGAANGHGWDNGYAGPYLIGVWGMRLAQHMIDSFGVPLLFINGGAGGSSIEENMRNDEQPLDLTTIYGRTLYRFERSGLRERVRAIFWHQGESNWLQGYYDNFRTLYGHWKEDYPSIERVYFYQIRPGCGGSRELRDLQRTIADSLPHITPLATVGLPGHDGCHYTYQGFTALADQLFRFVHHDIIGDTTRLMFPDISRAAYTTETRDEIVLLFDASAPLVWASDTIVEGALRQLADAFELDGVGGHVLSGRASGDTVVLRLRGPATAAAIGYVPHRNYPGTEVLYEGPWLLDETGLGAFAFAAIPIVAPFKVVTEPPISTLVSITPSPTSGATTIRFGLKDRAHVRLVIVDAVGRERVILDELLDRGLRAIVIDDLPRGAYRCVLMIDAVRSTYGFVVH